MPVHDVKVSTIIVMKKVTVTMMALVVGTKMTLAAHKKRNAGKGPNAALM